MIRNLEDYYIKSVTKQLKSRELIYLDAPMDIYLDLMPMNDTSSLFDSNTKCPVPITAGTLNESPNTPKDSQLMDVSDIDFTASFNRDDSSQSQPPITTTTPINIMKQTLTSNWSVQSVQHPLLSQLNSERDLDSFQFITKPMPVQSNISEDHIYDPGELCVDESDFSDAFESGDEPMISLRRKTVNVIEDSEDENDQMYSALILGIFHLNLMLARSYPSCLLKKNHETIRESKLRWAQLP
jgi:hypothetical protein